MSDVPIVTCETLLEQISGYLDGDLPEATCAAIEQHADGCQRCAHVIDDFRKTTGLCRKAATAPLPAHIRSLAKARIKELLEESPQR